MHNGCNLIYLFSSGKLSISRTSPLTSPVSELHPIISIPETPPIMDSRQNYFLKSLTTSMTLDRRSLHKNKVLMKKDQFKPQPENVTERAGSVSPKPCDRLRPCPLEQIHSISTPTLNKMGKQTTTTTGKKSGPINRINILKNYFEKKISSLGSKRSSGDRKLNKFSSLWKKTYKYFTSCFAFINVFGMVWILV